MTRRAIAFPCGGAKLYGMLDCAGAHGQTGLLIVSGGNEIRAGAFAGQAQLAARLAEAAGVPVFRFDRRGIGDSEGENHGWRGSRDDIAAALGTFRAALPGMRRVVGFGLCDAASALMLHAETLGPNGFDALLLANPWTIDDCTEDAFGHSPEALRRRYLARLADPRAVWRLLTGRVNLLRLARGLGRASRPTEGPSPLVDLLRDGLARYDGPATILLAAGDRIGARFAAVWPQRDPRVITHPGHSHSFTDDQTSRDWLFERLYEATASRH
jgi:exosortase A-associated hydrolase 1